MRGAIPAGWCLLAALLFGASTPASKALLDGVGPRWLTCLAYAGAALAVAPFARRPAVAGRGRRTAVLLVLASLCGGVLGPLLLFAGLRLAPAASTSVWLNLEATATALLGVLLFRERLGPRAWLANGLVVGSSALLAAEGGFALGPAAALVAFACVAWGFDNHLTALVDGVPPAATTLVKGATGALVGGGLALLSGEAAPGAVAVLAGLVVGALGYGASIVLYVRGAQALGASHAQMIFATAPFFGMAGAFLALGEPVRPLQLVAGAGVLGALALLPRDTHAHEHRHDALRHTHAHQHDDGHHGHAHDPPVRGWHTHEHAHDEVVHTHEHGADLHHRHRHG